MEERINTDEKKITNMMEERLNVKSAVFKWLREDSGYTIEKVAGELGIETKDIEYWEKRKEITLTYEQIKRLARLYDVPVTNFFLPEPPPYKPLPFLRRGEIINVSPKVHKIKRKARYLRSIIYEIDQENIENVKDKIPHYKIEEDPEECAKKESERFAIRLTRIERGRVEDLKKLKEKLAEIGIYTFELTMPLEEVRGFSLVDELPYIIVINAEDSINGKIFTLLHEYAHILLRDQRGCTEMEFVNDRKEDNRRIEYWCNTFVASFLVPRTDLFLRLLPEIGRGKEVDLLLESLSKQYNVSKYAIAVRILTLKQKEFRQLQLILSESKLIDRLREEAKEGLSERDKKRYLFAWEDVTHEGIELPDRFARFLERISKREVKDLLLRKCEEDKIEIVTQDNKEKVGEITIEGDKAILQYGEEYEFVVKRVDNKTNIYRPFILNKVNLRKNQLGTYFIDKVIDAYNEKIITTADLLEYLQIKTKDLPKILIG